jgi:hypothetical protein
VLLEVIFSKEDPLVRWFCLAGEEIMPGEMLRGWVHGVAKDANLDEGVVVVIVYFEKAAPRRADPSVNRQMQSLLMPLPVVLCEKAVGTKGTLIRP